ncbi:MAG: GNAT family N-acetyltransferase [Pikeienuella sp.]
MTTIRPLRQSDHADWKRMWTAYLEFYETSVEEDVYVTLWERLLGDDPQDFTCLVAENDGKLIGFTHYLFHRHAWRIDNVIYLQDLYVDPDVRGTGAGRALIEAVYAVADVQNAAGVYWLTQEFNHTARQLYDRIANVTPFIRYNR